MPNLNLPKPAALKNCAFAVTCALVLASSLTASVREGAQDMAPDQLRQNLAARNYSGKRIDLVFSKAGLQEVIAELQKAGGIPLILDPAINDPVTYRMIDVPWDEALAAVLADNGLSALMNLDGSGFKIVRGRPIVLAFPDGDKARAALFLYNNLFRIAVGILVLAILAAGIWIIARRRARTGPAARKSMMSPEAAEQARRELTRLLEEERIYRDDGLTLRSFADKLGVTPHRLSWLLNEELQIPFSALVNGYRIEEVKRRLADSSVNGDSILQTAMEAGFSSKASFNRAFKLNTGMTPSEYKKRLAP